MYYIFTFYIRAYLRKMVLCEPNVLDKYILMYRYCIHTKIWRLLTSVLKSLEFFIYLKAEINCYIIPFYRIFHQQV